MYNQLVQDLLRLQLIHNKQIIIILHSRIFRMYDKTTFIKSLALMNNLSMYGDLFAYINLHAARYMEKMIGSLLLFLKQSKRTTINIKKKKESSILCGT